MITAAYDTVRPQMRVGDVIAFGGHGFISGTIKLFTRYPVSHVGTVLGASEEGRVGLIESTTLADKKGVQVNYLSERIATYDGNVWWLPLCGETRAKTDWDRFVAFLCDYEKKHVSYDYRQCFRMVLAPLAHVPSMGILRNHEDLKRVFCSELVAAAYEYSGALPFGTDASDVAPADLCQMPFYGGVAQLKGPATELPRVGIVNQNGNRIVACTFASK